MSSSDVGWVSCSNLQHKQELYWTGFSACLCKGYKKFNKIERKRVCLTAWEKWRWRGRSSRRPNTTEKEGSHSGLDISYYRCPNLRHCSLMWPLDILLFIEHLYFVWGSCFETLCTWKWLKMMTSESRAGVDTNKTWWSQVKESIRGSIQIKINK